MILQVSVCMSNFLPYNKNRYKPENTTGTHGRTEMPASEDVFTEESPQLEKCLEVIKEAHISVLLVREQNFLAETETV